MKASNFMKNKKAIGTVSFVIGILVLIIVIATVALPIITAQVTAPVNGTAAVTGTNATILASAGTLLVVLVIVYIANAM